MDYLTMVTAANDYDGVAGEVRLLCVVAQNGDDAKKQALWHWYIKGVPVGPTDLLIAVPLMDVWDGLTVTP